MDSNPESKWIKKMKKNDTRQAKRFPNVFSFNGDLIALSDNGEFELNFKEIIQSLYSRRRISAIMRDFFGLTY